MADTNSQGTWLALAMYALLAIANFGTEVSGKLQPYRKAGYGCSPTKYKNGKVFEDNLAKVFASLDKNVSFTKFATASNGEGTDAVFGLAQCRNDSSTKDCAECYNEAKKQIVQDCAGFNGARLFYDGCFLRYENNSFFDETVDVAGFNDCNDEESVQPQIFNQTVHELLAKINSRAAENGGFAADKLNADGLPTTVYGLAMCRRTLSSNNCGYCLKEAVKRITPCLPRRDGKALEAGCYLHYFTYSSSSKGHSKIPIVLVGTIGGAALVTIICLLIVYKHSFRALYAKITGVSQYEEAEDEHFPRDEHDALGYRFNYDALKAATNNFHENNKIGEGGFSQVYKGNFSDGTEVAVKKLFMKHSTRAMDDFVTEVKLLSTVLHRNLVRLLGCCTRGRERLLVYEFVLNSSLDKHLFGEAAKNIGWKTRFQIILGTAHGLAYLNEESQFRIVHRDIKAANILLDNDFHPKIADFGLARLFPDDQIHLTTRVGGTIGYTAPEYAVHGRLTEKADVYSYGILVLEIVGGRKIMDLRLPSEMQLLLGWAWSLYEKNEAFGVVDRKLMESSECKKEEVLRVIHIALLCTQGAPQMRPSMSAVVSMLTSNTEILVRPTRPAFIDDNYDPRGSIITNVGGLLVSSSTSEAPSSNATVSISMEPR
uniref:TSA: Wollemia nobilis Ref_Wollemi_Transcript_14504_2337 transcribed RNA sequence n=1 Tax=Wollemia nobilis TaxID=56998 RepID=A0A0C9S6N5_9CONI